MSYTTKALLADHVLIGHGSADLWLKSTTNDADLEVCLTEVRPDGMDSYVQCGCLRASHRKLRHAAKLRPIKSHYEKDVEPLVPNE